MYYLQKRIIDLIISLFLLLVLSPFLAIISILILVESGRPIFYLQERVGKDWKNFKILKFRTMINKADEVGPVVTPKNDERITRIGRILRKYKIDELPQLINVFKGEMSIVGPRPEIPKFAKVFSKEYSDILKVRPGISDFAAIEFVDESLMFGEDKNVEDIYKTKVLPRKIKLYYQYLKEMSIATDLKIILATVRVLIK
jgi:lipopolysaccharide/colanic/teichoic acid biosynthesis glycosyltransferase